MGSVPGMKGASPRTCIAAMRMWGNIKFGMSFEMMRSASIVIHKLLTS